MISWGSEIILLGFRWVIYQTQVIYISEVVNKSNSNTVVAGISTQGCQINLGTRSTCLYSEVTFPKKL